MAREHNNVPPESHGDGARSRLLIPVSSIVTAIWVAAGVRAVWFGDVQVLVVVTGPFSLLCGYLFGISLMKRTEGESNG